MSDWGPPNICEFVRIRPEFDRGIRFRPERFTTNNTCLSGLRFWINSETRTKTMSVNEQRDRLSKRMRLGTRSCAECRRRKVRCTFAPNSTNCQECLAHNTTCLSQGVRSPENSNQENMVEMQRRLDGLESLVRQFCRSVPPQTKELESRNVGMDHVGSPSRQFPIPTNQSEGESLAYSQGSGPMGRSTSDIYATPSSQEISFEQAPLLGLLKDSLSIRQGNRQSSRIRIENSSELHVQEEFKELKALVPRLDELIMILELTEKYWHIWPVAFVIQDRSGHQSREDRIFLAKDLILEAFESDDPILIAKTFIWLALCVQQLTTDVMRDRTSFSVPFKSLCQSYLRTAQNLLRTRGASVTSFEFLECLLLQAKLHVNMGKPGQAWLNIRNALNMAILLGIHRPERRPEANRESLWTQIWLFDRNLSLSLGVPYAISESHLSVSRNDKNHSEEQRLMCRIGDIAGHILDRNLHAADTNDSATAQISLEIQDCWDTASQEWWDEKMGPDTAFEALYSRQTVKIYFYNLQNMLYLPYTFTSSTNPEYIPYRMAAVAASRDLVKCYQVFRNSGQTAIVMCDFMDFLAFSGAVIMVIDLLSRRSSHDTTEDTEDWSLVKRLIKTFKHLSQALDCTVASQGAELLNYLHMASEGTYHNPDGYKVVIPFFGKVQIHSVPTGHTTEDPALLDGSTQIQWSNTIEFGIQSSSESLASTCPSDIELGIDWTSFGDVAMDFDWTQIFHGAEYI